MAKVKKPRSKPSRKPVGLTAGKKVGVSKAAMEAARTQGKMARPRVGITEAEMKQARIKASKPPPKPRPKPRPKPARAPARRRRKG